MSCWPASYLSAACTHQYEYNSSIISCLWALASTHFPCSPKCIRSTRRCVRKFDHNPFRFAIAYVNALNHAELRKMKRGGDGLMTTGKMQTLMFSDSLTRCLSWESKRREFKGVLPIHCASLFPCPLLQPKLLCKECSCGSCWTPVYLYWRPFLSHLG